MKSDCEEASLADIMAAALEVSLSILISVLVLQSLITSSVEPKFQGSQASDQLGP